MQNLSRPHNPLGKFGMGDQGLQTPIDGSRDLYRVIPQEAVQFSCEPQPLQHGQGVGMYLKGARGGRVGWLVGWLQDTAMAAGGGPPHGTSPSGPMLRPWMGVCAPLLSRDTLPACLRWRTSCTLRGLFRSVCCLSAYLCSPMLPTPPYGLETHLYHTADCGLLLHDPAPLQIFHKTAHHCAQRWNFNSATTCGASYCPQGNDPGERPPNHWSRVPAAQARAATQEVGVHHRPSGIFQ